MMFLRLVAKEIWWAFLAIFMKILVPVSDLCFPFFLGILLKPVTIVTKGGNPFVSVLTTWFLVQVSEKVFTCSLV